MRRRRAWIAIAGLAVVCLALLVSVWYPFALAEPHAAMAPEDRFTVGDDAFVASGQIVTDGETALAFEGVVTAAGAWYERVVQPNVTTRKYYPGTGETVARHVRISGRARAADYREHIAENADRNVVRADRNGSNTTFVVIQTGDEGDEPVSGSASVFVNSLMTAGYDLAGTDTGTLSTYVPRDGWYQSERPYRITGASGSVRANPETLVVRSANVSWAVTVPAGSVAEYAFVTVAGEGRTTREITYDYSAGPATVDRPGWVPDGVVPEPAGA